MKWEDQKSIYNKDYYSVLMNLKYLVCQICHSELEYRIDYLQCCKCNKIYPVEYGIPQFDIIEECNAEVEQTNQRRCTEDIYNMAQDSIWQHTIGFPFYNYAQGNESYDLERYSRAVLTNITIKYAIDSYNCGIAVDVGTGPGWLSYLLSNIYLTVACDINMDEQIGLRSINPDIGKGILLVRAMGENIPILPNIADFITGMSVYHHLTDRIQFLNNAYRILKPGGILLLTGESPAKDEADLEYQLALLRDRGLGYEKGYTRQELYHTLSSCNFNNISYHRIKIAQPSFRLEYAEEDSEESNNGYIIGIKD